MRSQRYTKQLAELLKAEAHQSAALTMPPPAFSHSSAEMRFFENRGTRLWPPRYARVRLRSARNMGAGLCCPASLVVTLLTGGCGYEDL